jgi:hypothetical protein
MAYRVVLCRPSNIRPIKGADRIVVASFAGCDVVVSVADSKIEQDWVYWPSDGQIPAEILTRLDLYQKRADGSKGGGFFCPKGRVKAQTFMGVSSDGFAMPLSKLEANGISVALDPADSSLVKAMFFTAADGSSIMIEPGTKYVPQIFVRGQKVADTRTQAERAANQQSNNLVKNSTTESMMPRHYDTAHLNSSLNYIRNHLGPEVVLVATEKIHGTSQASSYYEEPVVIGGFKRFINKVCGWFSYKPFSDAPIVSTWHRTRNIFFFTEGSGRGSSNDDRRNEVAKWANTWNRHIFNYFKPTMANLVGVRTYYEITGSNRVGKRYMAPHNWLLSDSTFKRYKSVMKELPLNGKGGHESTHDYHSRVFIYRIVLVERLADGTNSDRELNVLEQQELANSIIDQTSLIVSLVPRVATIDCSNPNWYQQLEDLMKTYDCTLSVVDPTTIAEGFCLSFVDKSTGLASSHFGGRVLKYKGFAFKVGEGLCKDLADSGEAIADAEEEEAASNNNE